MSLHLGGLLTLGTRIRVFLAELPVLLREHEGEYALVHDDETPLVVFDNSTDAMNAGSAIYGDVTEFLVVKIEETRDERGRSA